MGEFDLTAGGKPHYACRARTARAIRTASSLMPSPLTDDLNYDPERDPLWTPAFDSGDVASAADTFTLPNPLPTGDYRWRVRIFNGDKLLDASGKLGVSSVESTFSVK